MTAARPRVAVIGAGIAGLGAAHALRVHADVTLFEADDRCGGHANTVDVTLDGITHGVDTGFLVFNHRTYPRLVALFESLGVATCPSEMSFSVQAPDGRGGRLEWCGNDLNGVFAQRRNLVSPRFHGMLWDLLRFNRLATALARQAEVDESAGRGPDARMNQPLGEFLDAHGFGPAFREGYLLPMIGCIWSCPIGQMLGFPVSTLIRFCHNHGLLQVTGRPTWHTVTGGSRHYVEAIVRGLRDVRTGTPVRHVEGRLAAGFPVHVITDAGREAFDEVVLAGHAPQSLALLSAHDADRRAALRALRTQPNEAVLHTDASVLPTRRRAWAAWNYERPLAPSADARTDAPTDAASGEAPAVCLHYLLNRLQPLPWHRPVVVSLNPVREPDAATVLQRFTYAHPVFDRAADVARAALAPLQGEDGLWFCGAWTGYGFHEDGLRSGQAVATALVQAAADRLVREHGPASARAVARRASPPAMEEAA